MFAVIEIIFDFWNDLFINLNNILVTELNLDLKLINLDFYSSEISVFDYFILFFTLITIMFVIYMTYKFFKFIYKVVVRLWY